MRKLHLVGFVLALFASACSSSAVIVDLAETGDQVDIALPAEEASVEQATSPTSDEDADDAPVVDTAEVELIVADEPTEDDAEQADAPEADEAALGSDESTAATQDDEVEETEEAEEAEEAVIEPPVDLLPSQFAMGHCFNSSDWRQDPQRVPCTQSHTVEIIFMESVNIEDGEPFPGDARMKIVAATECKDQASFTVKQLRDYMGLAPEQHWPNELQWSANDRSIVCAIVFDEPKTNSVHDIREAVRQAEAELAERTSNRLQVGACYTTEALDRRPYVSVPCTSPHHAEVFHIGELPDGAGAPNPGMDALVERVASLCGQAFQQRIGVPIDQTSLPWTVWVPSRSWDSGGRGYSCLVDFDEPVSAPISQLNPLTHGEKDSLYGILVGTCMYGSSIGDREIVDCSEPHNFQVIGTKAFDTSVPYPGDDSASAQTGLFCDQALRSSGLDRQGRSWTIRGVYSGSQSWATGTAMMVCFVNHRVPVTTNLFG